MNPSKATKPSDLLKTGPIKQDIVAVFLRHSQPFLANTERVVQLIRLAEQIEAQEPDLKRHGDDLLRAAVVFLHATVEELLRGLAGLYLPNAGEEVLNKVPIAGSRDMLNAEKFHLGRLVQHRGKTVDEVIQQSVRDHIARRTFSSVAEICSMFQLLGFSIGESGRKNFARMDALMARRHDIVHRADILKSASAPTPIDAETVRDWHDAVLEFFADVSAMDFCRSFPKLISNR